MSSGYTEEPTNLIIKTSAAECSEISFKSTFCDFRDSMAENSIQKTKMEQQK